MKIAKLTLIIMGIAWTACSSEHSSHPTLADMPVVAHLDTINGEPLTVCRLDLLKDTVRIPLSELVEELEIIRLDNRDEALVEKGKVYISDNYLLATSYRTPCKLFRKDGTYIGKVGDIGQGTGEYRYIHDAQIDEEHGHIYMLPDISRHILVYNLEGKFEGSIPIHLPHPAMKACKGIFQVDRAKNRVAILTLPFSYLPHVAWVQDLEGNLLEKIPSGHLKLKPNFSNEIIHVKATDKWSFHLYPFFELRKDSLYHWSLPETKLIPRFTLDYGEREISLHSYQELPLYYFGEIATPKQMTEESFMADQERIFIVDKATLRGGFCCIYNDYLCNEPVDWPTNMNGLYLDNVEPSVLLENIKKCLKELPAQDADRRQKLLDLQATIDKNDNNYIIYGKHRRER